MNRPGRPHFHHHHPSPEETPFHHHHSNLSGLLDLFLNNLLHLGSMQHVFNACRVFNTVCVTYQAC